MGNVDIAWKEDLEDYLEQAVALLFPDAHRQIDGFRGYEFLDKELQQIVREGETGTRIVDKLARIWLLNGQEQWVLLHVDVQGQPQEDFGQRMYVYNYRIFDRYGRLGASLAILADDQRDWRPDGFGYNLLGCDVRFSFPTAKLLDFVGKEAELEASSNPFAVVVLAYLESRQTAKDVNRRRSSKMRLIRGLYERGFGRTDVRRLFRLIHWFMVLPPEMERDVWREVELIEQEKQMRHMTPIEEIWLEDGKEMGRAEGHAQLEAAIGLALRLKFGADAAAALSPVIQSLAPAQLDDLLRLIETSASPDDLRQKLSDLH